MKQIFAVFCITLLLCVYPAFAAPPSTITYQGYLTNKHSGAAIDGSVAMILSLYDAAGNGTNTPLWSESQPIVQVVNGVYTVQLGSITALNLPFDTTYYLGVAVGGESEMIPRLTMTSAPTVFRAMSADKLNQACADGQFLLYSSSTSSWSCTSLSTVATSGSYTDLTNKPALATVASSGSYTDLSNKPLAGTDFLAPSGNGSALTGLNSSQVGLVNVENLKVNLAAAADPLGTGDIAAGYTIGSRWVNTTTGKEFVKVDANETVGSWKETTATGALKAASNLSDLTNPATARTNLGISNVTNVDTTNAANISSGTLSADRLPALTGDVTTNAGSSATTVALVGGASAANIATATTTANTATNLNTFSTIVKRDASGNFSAGTITANLAGNATSATSATSVSGTVGVANGGTGATTLTGYVKGSGTSAMTGSATIPATDLSGTLPDASFPATLPAVDGSLLTGVKILSFGNNNTTGGTKALFNNDGSDNSAYGYEALYSNTEGYSNTASGAQALFFNRDGFMNTAYGNASMLRNTTGAFNTAIGFGALSENIIGNENTASGNLAMQLNMGGSYNIALGTRAGYWLTTGDYNIDIGNEGVVAEANTIRIGDSNQSKTFIAGIRGVTTGLGNGIAVLIDANGQLGTVSSSIRYKEDVNNMGDLTSRLFDLRPVTFRYKTQPDAVHYGLIAEEVDQVMPELVVRGNDGQIETVAYHELTPMLLNELQKEHKLVQDLTAENVELKARLLKIEKALGL